jgi:hypothetical protein
MPRAAPLLDDTPAPPIGLSASFALPATLVMVAYNYLRPQEYFTSLAEVPVLYFLLGLAALGFVLDLWLRRLRPEPAPQLFWVLLLIAWIVVTLLRSPGRIPHSLFYLSVVLALFVFIGHGIQSFRALQWLGAALLAIALFLSVVGVHQRLQPMGCMLLDDQHGRRPTFDGRECESAHQCELGEEAEPGRDYACGRIGLLGTYSVSDRVRYLGTLEDPNELALAISVALPFAFAFRERRPSPARLGLLLATLGLVGTCTVYTQSRGGQLALMSVVAVYFVRSRGWKGLVVGAVLAAPLLALGGRSGEEADASSIERLECWREGFRMFRDHPLLGVGFGQFEEHHYLTAHNSVVFAAAELGFPGFVLFSCIIYLCVKIPVHALRQLRREDIGPEADVARTWAAAILASWAGMLPGMFFLSYCYKEVLWIFFGLSAALYSAMRSHLRDFEVGISRRELWRIVVGDVVILSVLYVYVRLRVGA